MGILGWMPPNSLIKFNIVKKDDMHEAAIPCTQYLMVQDNNTNLAKC